MERNSPARLIWSNFEKARANMQAENDETRAEMEEYESVMSEVRAVIDGVTDIETANAAAETLPNMSHALTSKKEASAMLKMKTDALGLKYTKEGYVPKEG